MNYTYYTSQDWYDYIRMTKAANIGQRDFKKIEKVHKKNKKKKGKQK